MRFSTENKALDYLIGKEVKDSANLTAVHISKSKEESKEKYATWIERKRFMFSPQEFEALHGKIQNQAVRNHYGNVFVDWAENKSRRRAIIVIKATNKTAANSIAKQIDIIGGDEAFSVGLSTTGKKPATHYVCNWNCSASEYDFFEKQKMPWWSVFDGQEMEFDEVLTSLGLKRVQEGLSIVPKEL